MLSRTATALPLLLANAAGEQNAAEQARCMEHEQQEGNDGVAAPQQIVQGCGRRGDEQRHEQRAQSHPESQADDSQ